MSQVLVEQFISSFSTPPTELVLDFDGTDDAVHGNQENRFFHGYYDEYCFLPLYVFCGDQLLCSYLRPSNIDSARHSWAILKLLVQRFRQAWPGVRIVIRGDSGFCRWRMLRWCERHDVYYCVGIARNSVLEQLAQPFMEQARQQFEQTRQKQRDFHEVQYAAQTWDRSRRVIVKAEHAEQGANPRFLVTNLADEPSRVYDGCYIARGDMENRIKEQQLDLFADRTSCHKFLANQFRLLLASAAYVLVEYLRRVGLKDTAESSAQVSTIRLKLFKIAAQIRISFRRIAFHFCSSYPYQELLAKLVGRLVPH